MFCCFYSYSFNVFRNTKEVINNNGLNAITTKRITFTTEGVNSFNHDSDEELTSPCVIYKYCYIRNMRRLESITWNALSRCTIEFS